MLTDPPHILFNLPTRGGITTKCFEGFMAFGDFAFDNGIVKVELQGSCSGCPSSTMTLKQGVQNLLCHYLPEVKEVVAIQ